MIHAPTVCVAGAGVMGLACALELVISGAPVLLLDPDDTAPNASAVAAGLLAPVGEALFDPLAARHYPLMIEALGLWPHFARAAGLVLVDQGVWIPTDHAAEAQTLGVVVRSLGSGGLVVGDMQVVDPPEALVRLRAAFIAAGGRFEPRRMTPEDREAHDFLVIAVGPQSPGLADIAPELCVLQPVKGQIAVLPHGPKAGPAVRWPGGYLAAQPSGARAGATMEQDRTDTEVEPEVIARLVEAARARVSDLDVRGAWGQAGVRMQTPDGLPLVGPSTAPGVLLAAGARRNGWLFAPLVAQMIAAYCRGQDAGAWADALHPGRFA